MRRMFYRNLKALEQRRRVQDVIYRKIQDCIGPWRSEEKSGLSFFYVFAGVVEDLQVNRLPTTQQSCFTEHWKTIDHLYQRTT